MGFMFDGRGEKKRSRRRVTKQEEDGANLIGGRRHIGSGAIPGLKSDASSKRWQQEAKQTEKMSIGIKVEWLDKITREARTQDKKPMLYIRFISLPSWCVLEKDWVMIPATAFGEMERNQ